MNISYSIPLSKGWERMKSALFQPFDLNNWLKLGFTAWLAGLCDCSGGSGGGHSNRGNSEWNEFFKFPGVAWEWLQSHPVWFSLIIAGIVVVIIIGIVCLWLSSRGKFMFLYNVAYGKTEMGLPWNEYRKQGNSLFLWRLFFSLISIILLGIFLYYCFLSAKDMFYGDYPGVLIFWNIATMVLIFFVYITSVGYTSLFLNDFVVPIMFKYRIGANHGWLKFLPLFGRYFFHFVLYGLFIFILIICVVVAVIFFGLFTLLLGFILLAIPFVGAVVLLPVSYTFRALSIEFLAQFGEEFNVFQAIGQVE